MQPLGGGTRRPCSGYGDLDCVLLTEDSQNRTTRFDGTGLLAE